MTDALSPTPMVLFCPLCHTRHIDEGEFETKPHHTHACQACGLAWRPAIAATVGVQFLPGFKNATQTKPADPAPIERGKLAETMPEVGDWFMEHSEDWVGRLAKFDIEGSGDYDRTWHAVFSGGGDGDRSLTERDYRGSPQCFRDRFLRIARFDCVTVALK